MAIGREESMPDGAVAGSILLVEDNTQIRKMLKTNLERHLELMHLSHPIIDCADPESALKVIDDADQKIVLGIFDHQFNGSPYTGLDLVAETRKHKKEARFIMIAGRAPEEGSRTVRETGVEAFFGKPFDLGKLNAKVRKLLKPRRQKKKE